MNREFRTGDPARRAAGVLPRPSLWILMCAIGTLDLGCSPVGMAIGAGATAGIAAAQERGIDGAVSDAQIRIEINHLWFQESEELYREIKLQVQDGRVLLSGIVDDPQIRVNAVRLAWQAPGVREVINEIRLTGDYETTDLAQDGWIAAQLKSRLVLDQDVRSINYSIEVVDQTVFLLGIARDRRELQRVIDHARDLAYVRRVVSYVQLRDSAAAQE